MPDLLRHAIKIASVGYQPNNNFRRAHSCTVILHSSALFPCLGQILTKYDGYAWPPLQVSDNRACLMFYRMRANHAFRNRASNRTLKVALFMIAIAQLWTTPLARSLWLQTNAKLGDNSHLPSCEIAPLEMYGRHRSRPPQVVARVGPHLPNGKAPNKPFHINRLLFILNLS